MNPGDDLPMVASIDETACIGCTLCIQACPVDAIVGLSRRMHTVLAELCTGCERCVAPCPVDCVSMQRPAPARRWTALDEAAAQERTRARELRLQAQRRREPPPPPGPEGGRIAALVAAAIAQARSRRASRSR